MTLHENEGIFRQAIQATSDKLQIRAVYVEKDYWVTFALKSIFGSEVGEDAVFKGGTALSKCLGIIQRFSEDLDLVMLRRDGESNSFMRTKLKKASKCIEGSMPEVEIEGVTNRKGMNRKTAHSYKKVFDGNYGQVRDVIVLESSWLGHSEPYQEATVSSLIYEMMLESEQTDFIKRYSMEPFTVRFLSPARTICEKIMSLVRFSHGANPIKDLKMKVRHTYDLHLLLALPELREFFSSAEFDDMLIRVGRDDARSFKNNNSWLVHHPSDSLFFKELDGKVWPEMEKEYSGVFADLVYGELPSSDTVLLSMQMIKSRLEKVDWKVQPGEEYLGE